MTDKTRFTCSDNEFKVESDEKEEVEEMGRMHVKKRHGMDISDEDLQKEISMI